MTKWIASALVLSALLAAGCSDRSAPPAASTGPAPAQETKAPAAVKKVVYTCPMHPEVQQATPGNCPQCGMTLVAKDVD